MPNDELTLFERLKRKRLRDIMLDPEGPRDPRLPDPVNKVQQGIDKLRQMRAERKAAVKPK